MSFKAEMIPPAFWINFIYSTIDSTVNEEGLKLPCMTGIKNESAN